MNGLIGEGLTPETQSK